MGKTRFKPPKLITAACSDVNKATTHKAKTKAKAKATYLKAKNTTTLASVLAIGQLYHQSATAPGCTTQLHDVCGLPLP